MSIRLLDQSTINKIAAGEVVDRPASVVKELVENAIDAGANAITVEIKDGGISFIRITDNGCGIPSEDIEIAFKRHSTSKIRTAADLASISSLGFRGEALSSISAVAQVELVTKTADSFFATRYRINGGVEEGREEIGAPEGTTFIVRNLFYNTPARKKFLKTPATEGNYISNVIEQLCLSHPEISFRYIVNNQPKIQTMGNNNLKDVIYVIYGRETAANLIDIEESFEKFSVKGYIGKPSVSRGNRSFENYYINGRYIKSNIISKAIEEAYSGFLMQHKYPFCAFHITIEPEQLDVNVHPSKMELRFANGNYIFDCIRQLVYDALSHRELIPKASVDSHIEHKPYTSVNYTRVHENIQPDLTVKEEKTDFKNTRMPEPFETKRSEEYSKKVEPVVYKQAELFDDKILLREENKADISVIGQVFDTYWIIQYEENMYIIDQHAAHEKVLFERFMKDYRECAITTQYLSPPSVISLTGHEEDLIKNNMQYLENCGFAIEPFGGNEYAIRGIPARFSAAEPKDMLFEILDALDENDRKTTSEVIRDRIATMACKAAVKGNNKISYAEAKSLISELMKLDNPYNCPHGRPTMISMSKYDIEKKFKRVL